jgi:hypothetical protein
VTLALLMALAAAPKPGTVFSVALRWDERLAVKRKGQVIRDDTLVDTKAKVRVDSVNGERPDVLTIEPDRQELPVITAREDSGAPVLTFSAAPSFTTEQVLKRAFGRLVAADAERAAMASCSADTEAATARWLQQAVARLNGSEPSEVALSDLKLACKTTKTGTKLELSFAAQVPRAMLTISLQQKGTLTVDRGLWFTQWTMAGPVHVTGEGVEVDGSFSSSLVVRQPLTGR